MMALTASPTPPPPARCVCRVCVCVCVCVWAVMLARSPLCVRVSRLWRGLCVRVCAV
ncbi:MAG: hypothetical protein P4L40_16955 [Terracidiphilus sp.]|nr:hypothetical protein [Terracidiphilus sp.]